MSDPNPAVTDPQSRSLFRSFVLDPALIFARVLDCRGHRPRRRRGSGQDPRPHLHPPGHPRRLPRPSSSATTTPASPPWPGCWPGAPPAGCPPARPTPAATARPASGSPRRSCPGWSATPPTASRTTPREAWLFHGRRVVLADGSTVSMPDTPENQAEYPQHGNQKPGCGFPIARIVVLICPGHRVRARRGHRRRQGEADRRDGPDPHACTAG